MVNFDDAGQALLAAEVNAPGSFSVTAVSEALALMSESSVSHGAGLEHVITTVARLLKHPDDRVTKEAGHWINRAVFHPANNSAYVIAQLARLHPDVLVLVEPTLVRLSRSGDPGTRVTVCKIAADRAGPEHRALLNAVFARLRDKNPEVRFAAVTAFLQLGATAAPALPRLRRLLHDKDQEIRLIADEAVSQIEAALESERESLSLHPEVMLGGTRPATSATARRDKRAASGRPPSMSARERSHFLPDRAGQPQLYPWQIDALEAWRRRGRCGVVEAVTGAGKTRIGFAAMEEEIRAGGKVLVIVPSSVLLDQWLRILRTDYRWLRAAGHGDGERSTLDSVDVLVTTVQSAMRVTDRILPDGQGLLIADECHRYGAERFSEALHGSFPRRLGLSATYQRADSGLAEFLLPYFGKSCFKLDYDRALQEGVISPFRVLQVLCAMRPDEQEEYDRLDAAAKEARWKLISRYGVPEEPFGKFMKAVLHLAEFGTMREGIAAKSYISAFTKRRILISDTPAKLNALRHLVPVLKAAERGLVFSETVAGATEAAAVLQEEGVAAEVVHGGVEKSVRQGALNDFNAGRITVLCAPKVLDEGIDVPAADVAVVLAASRTERQMIQRMGRVIRRKPDGDSALLILLAIKDTFEDPAQGGHEAFLGRVTGVAERSAVCGVDELDGLALAFWRDDN